MNNEDKILAILEQLTVGQAKLETGQAAMAADISDLKTGQFNLAARIEDIHQTLAKLEIENEQAHGGIHDKLDIIENRTDIIAEDIGTIKERVDAGDLYIRLFNKKLNQT